MMSPAQLAQHRTAIAAQTAEFLANGGQIQQLPYSPDGFNSMSTLDKLELAKRHRARINGAATPNWNRATDPKFNNQTVTTAEQRRRANGRKNRFKKTDKQGAAA